MYPSEQSQKRKEMKAQKNHCLCWKHYPWSFICSTKSTCEMWGFLLSFRFLINYMSVCTLHLMWPFAADNKLLHSGKWATERCPNYFKKKWIHGCLEPWTPATVCCDRISNVDFREENLKSNIKIFISSKQQLHSLICCVFHALVK